MLGCKFIFETLRFLSQGFSVVEKRATHSDEVFALVVHVVQLRRATRISIIQTTFTFV